MSAIAAELLRPYVDEVDVDGFGNVTGIRRCGIPGAKKVMLDAHLDQIGFLVTEITDEGFLRFMGMGLSLIHIYPACLSASTSQRFLACTSGPRPKPARWRRVPAP